MLFRSLALVATALLSSNFVTADPRGHLQWRQSPTLPPNPLASQNLTRYFPLGNESFAAKTFNRIPKGPYNVSITEIPHFPNRTVYLPLNTGRERIPIVAWENGICYFYGRMYADFLSEIASHGYLVIAPGMPFNYTRGFSNSQNMAKTIDLAQDWDTGDFDLRIDTRNVAIGGHSCGGMLAVSLASRDPRVITALVFNSEANKTAQLDTMQASSLWIHGGKADGNVTAGVEKNFKYLKEKRKDLSVFKAVMQTGHMGTYWLPRGGAYAEAAVHWLDWHLKDEDVGKEYFVGGQKSGAAVRGWGIDSINIE